MEGLDPAKLMAAVNMPSDTGGATPPGGWEPPLPEELGDLMPGYEILGLLGRGGMGAVYKGIQQSLDREVAIKLLPPELGRDPEFEARFRREAKSMAMLNHPNIVQIFDFGQTTEGHHFFVMEFVEGTDLHQLIRSGELEPEGALNAVSQICDALEYAHEEGFVHRDIKPANIFINGKGILKVGDFGLAKLVDGEEDPAAAEKLGLTMTGVAMGSANYIAPEQLEESYNVDRRADIYSLGVMFYEMLTGEIPRGAVREPSKKNPRLDVRIDGVVFKAMESNRDERYQSATDLRTDVDGIRLTPTRGVEDPDEAITPAGAVADSGEESSRKPAHDSQSVSGAADGRKKPKAGRVAAMVVTMLLAIGGGAYFLNARSGDEETTTESAGAASTSPAVGTSSKPPNTRRHYADEPPQTPVTFPLPDPIGYPPLPTEKCRLVVVRTPLSNPKTPLAGFAKVEADDETDIVKLASDGGIQGAVVAISSSGQPILWEPGGIRVAPRDAKSVEAFNYNRPLGFLWIDKDGNVSCHTDVEGDDKSELEALKNVVYAKVTNGLFFGITSDGKRHLIGPGKDLEPIASIKKELDRIHQISFAGPNFSTFLTSEGEKIGISPHPEEKDRKAEGKFVHLFYTGAATNENGRLEVFSYEIEEFLSNANRAKQSSRCVAATGSGGLAAFQMLDGPWVFGWKVGEKWEESEKLGVALNGATQVEYGSGNFFYALLPADTVPRSGLWDIDELIAAREKIRKEKPATKLSASEPPSSIVTEGSPSQPTAEGYYTGEPPQAPVTYPLPDPIGYPPLPTTKCRIVIIVRGDTESTEDVESFAQVEKADYSDVVKFGDEIFGAGVAAIRENGIPLLWTGNGDFVEGAIDAHARALWNSRDNRLYWVDKNRKIQGINLQPEEAKTFSNLSNVVRLNALDEGGVFVISDDGKRTCVLTKRSNFSIDELFPMGLDDVLERWCK